MFEHPVEVENLREVGTLLELERANFVRFIFNGSWNSVTHREGIDRRLKEYEQTVAVAADEGINMADKMPVYQWDYIQSVFFTSTILTTIGMCHSNIAAQFPGQMIYYQSAPVLENAVNGHTSLPSFLPASLLSCPVIDGPSS